MQADAYRIGAGVLILALGSIGVALGFEHIGGYRPCPLCLMQRWAYYAGVPALFLALVRVAGRVPRAASLVFASVSLAFLANAGLGIHHSGVEWEFWAGPDTCAGVAAGEISSSSGDLLKGLREATGVVRCDRAPWRLFGLSFAGWNAVVSAVAAWGSLRAAISSLNR